MPAVWRVGKLNAAIYLDTVTVIDVKVCMMATVTRSYHYQWS